MSSPIKSEYLELVHKFIAGTISSDEMELLDRYYSIFRNEPGAIQSMDQDEMKILEDRLAQGIAAKIKQIEKPVIPLYRRTWFSIAAAVIIVSTVLFTVFIKSGDPQNDNRNSVTSTGAATRFLMLSDSSRIVLNVGSKLEIASNFKVGVTREVTLSGEAYFDIKHDNKRPFIIHTRGINTTVLGTAFNIKAYPGQKNIVVTVTRGRVKVERGKDLLAVVTPNKQYTASTGENHEPVTTPKKVIAMQSVEWAKSDMSFDAMPFSQLATRLEKRYDVKISFKNPELAACPITGSFNGTESLTEVLDILSQTRGTNYSVKGTQVIIDGKGCNEN